MNNPLHTFDGLDNRREVMILLQKLGTDADRVLFLRALITRSVAGFEHSPLQITEASPVNAYFMFVSLCNELGVPINEGVLFLEQQVRKKDHELSPLLRK